MSQYFKDRKLHLDVDLFFLHPSKVHISNFEASFFQKESLYDLYNEKETLHKYF
jgi:hypothetical protein